MRRIDQQDGAKLAAANNNGTYLGVVLLVVLIAPQIAWMVQGYENVDSLQKAAWAFYASAILAFSVRQKEKSFLFGGILWIFRTIHIPRSELFAYVYSAAFFALGMIELHTWSHLAE